VAEFTQDFEAGHHRPVVRSCPSAGLVQPAADAALQTLHRFRYPLSELVGKRVPARNNENGELLTDDCAQVNLYETTPTRAHKHE